MRIVVSGGPASKSLTNVAGLSAEGRGQAAQGGLQDDDQDGVQQDGRSKDR